MVKFTIKSIKSKIWSANILNCFYSTFNRFFVNWNRPIRYDRFTFYRVKKTFNPTNLQLFSLRIVRHIEQLTKRKWKNCIFTAFEWYADRIFVKNVIRNLQAYFLTAKFHLHRFISISYSRSQIYHKNQMHRIQSVFFATKTGSVVRESSINTVSSFYK